MIDLLRKFFTAGAGIERIATILARVFAGLVAAACAVGLGYGAPRVGASGAGAVVHGASLVALLVAIAAGAVAAWRGWGPARLLGAVPRRAFVGAVVAIALATGVWAHHRIQRGVPDVPDELGYLHQARTFSAGELTAPSPPAPEFYYVSWGVHDHDRWYAVFPPGYGALLALGDAAGAPWIVNPLLGAALVVLLFLLAEDVLGRDSLGARLAILLYLASWFRLMHAGSFMAHPAAALAAMLAVVGLLRGVVWHGRYRRAWAAAGGAGLAFLLATRQLDAVIVAAVLAPALALGVARGRRPALVRLGLAVACALPLTAGYLAYNRALTGDALVAPQQRYMQMKEKRGDCFRVGFGPGVGECPITQNTSYGPGGFAPKHAVANSRKRLDAWVRYSFGWAPFAILPIVALLGAAVRGGAAARRRAFLGGVFVATVVGYGAFFYHGVIYGARFYYLAWPFVLIASAAGLVELGALVGRLRAGPARAIAAGALGAAVPVVLVTGMIAAWPAVKQHCGKRPRTQDGALVRALADPALRDALVFVDSMTLPATVTAYPTAPARNRPLVVKDLGDAADAGFARLFPGRRPLRMQGRKFVPLAFAADAPMRHEGGALYPLDDARGGFGDRAPAPWLGNVPLSGGEALRFTLAGGDASFSLPVWALAADAGAMTLELAIVHHPGSPPIDVLVDGAVVATGVATDGPWAIVPHPMPVELVPGRHRVGVRTRGNKNAMVAIDYLELRRR